PGADPADLAQRDPTALRIAVESAVPFLSFRLERALSPERLQSPEARARAAEAAVGMISEHPNELVRDQYVMKLADRTTIEADRLRARVERAREATGTAPAARSPASAAAPQGRPDDPPAGRDLARAEGSGRAPGRRAGRDALILAIHDRPAVTGRLHAALFSDPLQRRAFAALDGAADLHGAIASTDDESADLLRRLAVAEAAADADQTIVALARSGAGAALRELEGRARRADAESDEEGLSEAIVTIGWLKRELEQMSQTGVEDLPESGVIETADRLIAWLASRTTEAV
ncbi:MAG: hypothetical protein ACRD0B_11440, partial [Acidimicrobiales bacterium]